MQGIFIEDTTGLRRPKSKKEVKELVAAGQLNKVVVEATSIYGNEHQGRLSNLVAPSHEGGAKGETIHFVGPCPYTRRNFYGSIAIRFDGKVVVK